MGIVARKPLARFPRLAILRDVVIVAILAVLVSLGVKTYVVRSFFIPSGSMESTLQVHDRILVSELEPRFGHISHGDVIVFKDPGGWLEPKTSSVSSSPVLDALRAVAVDVGVMPSKSDRYLVKRVIGLPGDTVQCCTTKGQLEVNGRSVAEPYVKLPSVGMAVSGTPFRATVPSNSVWVMGDNRYFSSDSRAHVDSPTRGFVPYSSIVGRAFAITWPLNRLGWLDEQAHAFRRAPLPEASGTR